jgi:transcriptional regulator with XRE-family HTH domain
VIPNVKLEAARLERRWSLAVASEKVGVSANTFNRWERGLQVPQLSTLDNLCQVFGLTPIELGFAEVLQVRRRSELLVTGPEQPQGDDGQPVEQTRSSFLTPVEPVQKHTYKQQEYDPITVACVEQARRSFEKMDLVLKKGGEGISRRQIMTTLLGAPAAVFGITQGAKHALHPEEILLLCSTNIPLAWQLYFEGGLIEVEPLLHSYLTRLQPLLQHSSTYQKRAAGLASQGYQLASLVTLQHQNFGAAYHYATQGFTYGQQAGDANLQTASLIRQAQVLLYLKQPRLRLRIYQQALQMVAQVSPLLRGRIYAGLAETYSKLGEEQAAQQALDMTHTCFPDSYTNDPVYPYSHFDRWSISSFEGMTRLHLRQPEQAWNLYSWMDKQVPDQPVPMRLELLRRQAETAYVMDDCEMTCIYVIKAATAARSVGNDLRLNEVYNVYEKMQGKWGHERQVKTLEELFC